LTFRPDGNELLMRRRIVFQSEIERAIDLEGIDLQIAVAAFGILGSWVLKVVQKMGAEPVYSALRHLPLDLVPRPHLGRVDIKHFDLLAIQTQLHLWRLIPRWLARRTDPQRVQTGARQIELGPDTTVGINRPPPAVLREVVTRGSVTAQG